MLGVRRRVVTGPKPVGGAGDRGGTWAWEYGLGPGLGAGLELFWAGPGPEWVRRVLVGGAIGLT